MLYYEILRDSRIRVKLEPTSNHTLEDSADSKGLLLNYYIPEKEMGVYLELTGDGANAFSTAKRYLLPTEEWVYCERAPRIEDCMFFHELTLDSQDGDVLKYKYRERGGIPLPTPL